MPSITGRVTLKHELRLVLITSSTAGTFILWKVVSRVMPALLTRMSIGPSWLRPRGTIASARARRRRRRPCTIAKSKPGRLCASCQACGLVLVAIVGRDLVPWRASSPADGGADAAGSAGNQCDACRHALSPACECGPSAKAAAATDCAAAVMKRPSAAPQTAPARAAPAGNARRIETRQRRREQSRRRCASGVGGCPRNASAARSAGSGSAASTGERALVLAELAAVPRRAPAAGARSAARQVRAARCSRIWRGVESSRSAPRTTSVMPCAASSTTTASWYAQQPSARRIDEIADLAREILRDAALDRVVERDRARRHAQRAMPARATRSRGATHVARMDAVERLEIAAAAPARIDGPAARKLRERRGVGRSRDRLWWMHRLVGRQAERRQRREDVGVGAGDFARRIEILHAHDPAARPHARAHSQLPTAATSEPKCSRPVGEGAKRPR